MAHPHPRLGQRPDDGSSRVAKGWELTGGQTVGAQPSSRKLGVVLEAWGRTGRAPRRLGGVEIAGGRSGHCQASGAEAGGATHNRGRRRGWWPIKGAPTGMAAGVRGAGAGPDGGERQVGAGAGWEHAGAWATECEQGKWGRVRGRRRGRQRSGGGRRAAAGHSKLALIPGGLTTIVLFQWAKGSNTMLE